MPESIHSIIPGHLAKSALRPRAKKACFVLGYARLTLPLPLKGRNMTAYIDIPQIICIFAAASLVLTAVYLLWFWCQSRGIKRCASPQGEIIMDSDSLPPLSVIVYAQNDAQNLRANLPYLLNQEYPEYEVIVVNDGRVAADSTAIAEAGLQYHNIYETFVPEQSHNLSRKKLALMMGIKAAKHEVILTTAANCRPTSPQWLEMMARNFVPGVEVVLGQSTYDVATDTNFGRRHRFYSSLVTRMLYLGYAGRRKPYRGTSDNIAYLKSKFFANKGFSSSMNLHHGDDDIFVNEITDSHNTRVELSAESILTANLWNAKKILLNNKLHHDFTSRYVKTSAFCIDKLMNAIYCLDFLAIVVLAVAAIATGLHIIRPTIPSISILGTEAQLPTIAIIAGAAALMLLLLLTIPHTLMFGQNCKLMHEPKLRFTVPLFTLIRPIINLRHHMRGQRYRIQNFTWQRPKK